MRVTLALRQPEWLARVLLTGLLILALAAALLLISQAFDGHNALSLPGLADGLDFVGGS
jgi:hypothetical protein